MFSLKKNNVMAGVLVVMVATAGYLNFTQKDVNVEETEISYENILDTESITVMADDEDSSFVLEEMSEYEYAEDVLDPLTAEAESEDRTGEAIFVNNDMSNTYFVQAKLDREQSRAKQKDMLTDMLNSKAVNDEQKKEFANSILDLQQRIEKEAAAEDMIKAKGFSEAYVRIDDETVDVVVNAQSLTDQQAAQIEDIVKRKTGMSADKIRISTIKSGK